MSSSRPSSSELKQEFRAQLSLSALRVTVGIIMAAHGWLKLMDMAGTARGFDQLGMPAPHLLVYLAIIAELLGGLALAAGCLTRIAALGPLSTMLLAIIVIHAGHGLLAKNGGFEYPLVLVLVCGFFAVIGGGRFSVDEALDRAEYARARRRARQVIASDG